MHRLAKQGELLVGDISTIPYADGSFDAVIDNEAVCCNDFNVSMLIYAEAARVTRSGGGSLCELFASGSWGDGTGENIGHNAWKCSEGPLKGNDGPPHILVE